MTGILPEHRSISVKISVLIAVPLLLVSCSDLTPKDQDDPPAQKNKKVKPPKEPGMADEPRPTSEPTIEGFILKDPDTTNELLTEDKKKTVSAPTNTPPSPASEPDNGIAIEPPKLPDVKIPEEE